MNGQKIEQHVARVKNAQIYYEVSGEGPAVVLLHGLSGSTRWWRKNVPVLSRRYRVYAIDMIGFGRSRGQPFVMQETAGRIIDWMDGLGEERFHLVGHSMGGLVSAEIAAQCPEQVGRLVLVDAVALPLGHSILRSAINLTAALRHVPVDFLPVLVKDALRAGPLTLLKASYSIHQVDLRPDAGTDCCAHADRVGRMGYAAAGQQRRGAPPGSARLGLGGDRGGGAQPNVGPARGV